MSLTEIFFRKLKLQMRLLHVVQHRPAAVIKLDPLNQEQFVVSLQSVKEWSEDNLELYDLILKNGMAQFICNRQYLLQFYRRLSFIDQNITTIDSYTLRLSNLTILNLTQNNISTIENIPQKCKELYLDFNNISGIKNKEHHLQLLSVSHNNFDDKTASTISHSFPELRCLNISHNKLCDLKKFVLTLANFSHLKILVAYNNPISLLKIYYSYITDHIELGYIDGSKYVKQIPVKEEPVKVQEKKEVKQQKKDNKKDNKKQGKVEQKIQQPPKVQIPVPVVKKELTNQDFQSFKITVKISNLEQHTGNTYEPSLFPADVDISKTQTCYWVKSYFMGTVFQQKQKIIAFDNTVVDGNSVRINLDSTFTQTYPVNQQNYHLFNEGLRVEVCQIQPKMIKDPQTLELKPQIKQNQVICVQTILGGCRVDLREIHSIKQKTLTAKYRLFNSDVAKNPLYYDPFQNEAEIIEKKKQKFQKELKLLEQEKVKKAEQQELLRQQKKGKDQKKAPQKKAAKKDGKDAVVSEKRKAEKCEFPIDGKLYSVVEQERIVKGKELLCIDIKIQ